MHQKSSQTPGTVIFSSKQEYISLFDDGVLVDKDHRGQKLVNYSGHGSVNQWRGNLLTSDDALALRNDRLPVFVMDDLPER